MRRAVVLATVIACGKSDPVVHDARTEHVPIQEWWCGAGSDDECRRDQSRCLGECTLAEHPYCFEATTRPDVPTSAATWCFLTLRACVDLMHSYEKNVPGEVITSKGCYRR